MKMLAMIAGLAVVGCGLTACNSKAQNEVDQIANGIDKRAEANADILEASEAGGPNAEAAKEQADAIRRQDEETKDHLKKEARELGSVPR